MTDTQKIKQAIDIVGLLREYIEVKPAGSNFKACCPFHNEKTPSFMINPDRQRYHCFGCGKDGDIFTFVQDHEGMEFVEALQFLANKAGIELSGQRSAVQSSQKNRIKDILTLSAQFYHNVLTRLPASKAAMDYVTERGLTAQTIEIWQIGFVPDQWDLLTQYLLKKGHSLDDIVEAGLTIKKDTANARTGKGFYDRFRGRIMFPIWDEHDYVVGFTGRVLVETEKSGGKYVNTPQTIVFDKSRVLFGLNKAKATIRTTKVMLLMEGQMDVIAAHQAGYTNAIASSGTALTAEQIQLMKRYGDTILFAFDSDAAGLKAAKRGIDLAIEAGMQVKVIQIPQGKGKDPDDCIRQYPDAWKQAVESATDIMDWYILSQTQGKSLTDPREKSMIADTVLSEIQRLPSAVEKDHWLGVLSLAIHVDIAILREQLAHIRQQDNSSSAQARGRAPSQASGSVSTDPSPVQTTRMDRVWALFAMHPVKELAGQIVKLSPTGLDDMQQPLYETVKMLYDQDEFPDQSTVLQSLDAINDGQLLATLRMNADRLYQDFNEAAAVREGTLLISQIINTAKKQTRASLIDQLKQAEQQGDSEQVQALLTQLQSM